MRRPLLALLTTALVLVLPLAAGAHGEDGRGDDVPADLAGARDRARSASAEINRVETELGELDDDLRRLEAEAADARRELGRLRQEVALVAVERYTKAGSETLFFPGADLNQQQRAEVLARIVTQADTDAIDGYRATRERLEEATEELEGRRAEQRELAEELRAQRGRLDRELERLETLDAGRRAARQAAAEQAAAPTTSAPPPAGPGSSTSVAVGPAPAPGPAPVSPAPAAAPAPTAPPPPPSPSAPPSAGGGWLCPVQGPMSFVDSWGAARAGGRSHQGVDLMAPRATPVVTPVAGTVTLKTGGIGGLTYRLDGVDGNWYYGAHLDAYAGRQGYLPAGTVVGYVGDTGDAAGAGTHLHFEIHIGGYGNPTNPYPTVSRYC